MSVLSCNMLENFKLTVKAKFFSTCVNACATNCGVFFCDICCHDEKVFIDMGKYSSKCAAPPRYGKFRG